MTKAIYYHAGCAICVEAERSLLPLLDHKQVDIEVVHLAEQSARIAERKRPGSSRFLPWLSTDRYCTLTSVRRSAI